MKIKSRMAQRKDNVRQKAEEWFIENFEATQAETAELFKVTTKTIGTWYKKYNWEEKRLDYHSSPVKIKQLIQRDMLNIAQGKAPTIKADALSKFSAALDRFEKKLDPFVVKRVLSDLDSFISEYDPEFAKECLKHHKRFLMHRIDMEL